MTPPLPLAVAALALLAACGTVAPEAPPLLPQAEIVARTEGAADSRRGEAAADALGRRAAALRARADRLRRADPAADERDEMLRRARDLSAQSG